MIQNFPNFKKLNIQNKSEIKKHTGKYLPYSDFNFMTLWCYNLKNKTSLSILNENLVVKLIDCSNNNTYLTFFGDKKFENTSVILLDYCLKNKITPILKYIPEIFIKKNYKYTKINISEDRHNHDYVYFLEDLSNLKGKKYNTKRYLFRKFNKLYPSHNLKIIDLNNKSNHNDILNLFHTWVKVKNKNQKDTKNEFEAILNLLKYKDFSNFLPFGIYINNHLAAFIISEIVHHNYAIVHFAKTDSNHIGINEALYKYLADALLKNKCKYVNFEQDLGLKNLRYAKTLWNPIFFLKKYDITLSNN